MIDSNGEPEESLGIRPPAEVRLGCWGFLASGAIMLISMLGYATLALPRLTATGQLMSGVEYLVLPVANGVLAVWFAVVVRDGRNWARIGLTVLAMLDLVDVFRPGLFGVDYLNAIAALIGAVCGVQLHVANANAYFAAVERRDRARSVA